jgi:dTDP-4-dehydrorhamnose 3,5-epimerase
MVWMRIESLAIAGVKLVRLRPTFDDRGFFARAFDVNEFAQAGLPTHFVQSSVSFNLKAGTVRGMHFQWPPSTEGKLVRCTRGAMHDVFLDLRPESASYLMHAAVRLDPENRDAVYIPHGVAHGFMSLEDSTEVHYQMTDFFASNLGAGFRWNDPAFGIVWPRTDAIVVSERDTHYPDFDRHAFEAELQGRR